MTNPTLRNNTMKHLATLILAASLAVSACKSTSDDVPEQKRMTEAEAAAATGEQAGAPVVAPGAVDWCKGHGLPESKCTKCNPQLTAGFKEAGDWCAEHELPESACPVCNPQTPPSEATAVRAGSADDWCAGHALPESMCTKCNPELTAQFQESGDWCQAHGFPESACPTCSPMTAPDSPVDQHEHVE